jgi:curved DNA-binding protein CbpA/GGDEF domain-containing protein
MSAWVDYYRTLQVHPDAEWEVIQGAYRRLCKKYHPDVNPSPKALEKIAEINTAYEVLGDPIKRTVYHSQWIYHQKTDPPAASFAASHSSQSQGTLQAQYTLYQYFEFLTSAKYRDAFDLLSDVDKSHFPCSRFVEWQKAVSAVYEIGQYKISLYKAHPDFKMDEHIPCLAEEYKVTVQEKNKRTGHVTEYSFSKYVVSENSNWKLYLGYRDLTPLLIHFRKIASDNEKEKMSGTQSVAPESTDLVTGLPNRLGLEASLSQEIYRCKRYTRPFSFAVIITTIPEQENEPGHKESILKYIGYLIHQYARTIDHVGYLDEMIFGIVFSETDREKSLKAIRRILKVVKIDLARCFNFPILFKAGVISYTGQTYQQLISACMQKASRRF